MKLPITTQRKRCRSAPTARTYVTPKTRRISAVRKRLARWSHTSIQTVGRPIKYVNAKDATLRAALATNRTHAQRSIQRRHAERESCNIRTEKISKPGSAADATVTIRLSHIKLVGSRNVASSSRYGNGADPRQNR